MFTKTPLEPPRSGQNKAYRSHNSSTSTSRKNSFTSPLSVKSSHLSATTRTPGSKIASPLRARPDYQYHYALSPGPALAILSSHPSSNNLTDYQNTQLALQSPLHYHHQNSKIDKNIIKAMNEERGKIAAAALAASENVPLPLKKPIQQLREEDIQARVKRGQPVTLEQYKVDKDEGIITCVCGSNEDDGFTIQCDSCFRWVHASCYHIEDIDLVPDYFTCRFCEKLENLKSQGEIKEIKAEDSLDFLKSKESEARAVTQEQYELKKKPKKESSNDSANKDSSESNQRQQPKQKDSGKKQNKQKQQEGPPNDGIIQRVKLKQSKDMHSAIYFPLRANEYVDKYVEEFVQSHNDEDWIITPKTFKNLKLEVKPYKEEKQFSGVAKLGCFLKADCVEKNGLIHEVVGEIDYQRKYIMDPRNQYRIWGTAKPKVLFHPHWPIYIDNRLSGNDCRYLRKSCHPNVELVTIKIDSNDTPLGKNMISDPKIKFVLRALRPIEVGEELTINWGWDLQHPIWKLIHTQNLEDIPEAERYFLIHTVESILSFCDCACSNNKECYLRMVKKYYIQLFKRNKTKMNNKYKLNEILYKPKNKEGKQSSILLKLQTSLGEQEKQAQVYYDSYIAKRKLYLEKLAKAKESGHDFDANSLLLNDQISKNELSSEKAVDQNDSALFGKKSTKILGNYKLQLVHDSKTAENFQKAESLKETSEQSSGSQNKKRNLSVFLHSLHDETQVTDINNLPIPIMLKPSVLNSINTILESKKLGSPSMISPNISPVSANSMSFPTVGAGSGSSGHFPNPQTVAQKGISAISAKPVSTHFATMMSMPRANLDIGSLHDSHQSSLVHGVYPTAEPAEKKKKLSFADYRRKSKPT